MGERPMVPKWLENAEARASEEERAYRTIRRVEARLRQEAEIASRQPGGDNPAAWAAVEDELIALADKLRSHMEVFRRALAPTACSATTRFKDGRALTLFCDTHRRPFSECSPADSTLSNPAPGERGEADE